MPTFIDESGGTSHHKDAKPYFRLCAAWVSADQATHLRARLAESRQALGLPANFEFKYHKTHYHPARREAFYSAALGSGFRFYVSCIDHRSRRWRRAERDDCFYATAMDLAGTFRLFYLAEEARCGRPLREPVTVDDNQDPLFLNIVRRAFHEQLSALDPRAKMAQRPEFAKSHVADLLQLADMACGAVGEMLDGGSNTSSQWYDRIAPAGIPGHAIGSRRGVGEWE